MLNMVISDGGREAQLIRIQGHHLSYLIGSEATMIELLAWPLGARGAFLCIEPYLQVVPI